MLQQSSDALMGPALILIGSAMVIPTALMHLMKKTVVINKISINFLY